MNYRLVLVCTLLAGWGAAGYGQSPYELDSVATAAGELELTFIGHGTLMFRFQNLIIHIDPVSRYADYAKLPSAGLILITHHHGDHLDPAAVRQLSKPDTVTICPGKCAGQLEGAVVMNNGDSRVEKGIKIDAVPAYNIVHRREGGEPYHPKGEGNGYVLTMGGKRVYIAGDTENIPEMKSLSGIDIAFLPMNLPYTMTPEMVADAVRAFRPRIVYPYHYGNTDPVVLTSLLKDLPDCEVRIRKLR